MKKKLLFLLFPIIILSGLVFASSASATLCPTDNGAGVGCLDPSYPYFCGGQCRGSQPQCPSWTPSPICANGITCTNFSTAAASGCGYGTACNSGYTACGSWPTNTCVATVAPVSPCSTYNSCGGYCSACIGGYNYCSGTHACAANVCTAAQTWNSSTCACVNMPALQLGYDSVSGSSIIQSATYPTLYIPSSGYVGIGTAAPSEKLTIAGGNIYFDGMTAGVSRQILFGNTANNPYAKMTATHVSGGSSTFQLQTNNGSSFNNGLFMDTDGNVGIGITAPNDLFSFSGSGVAAPAGSDATGHNFTDSYLSSDNYALVNYGLLKTMTLNTGNAATTTSGGDLNMQGYNILNVNKLTVNTIDPLYNIRGINYSTYAPSISGGVKEEYVGKVKIVSRNPNNKNEYEKIIDFATEPEGTDLWVWHNVVDYNFDNVEVLMTPYGKFANTYYLIKNNQLIFRSDRPVTLSYRLIGRRFDWRKWPTRAVDQNEKGMLIE